MSNPSLKTTLMVGGLGGLTPVFIKFLLLDGKTIASYIVNFSISGWYLLGYLIQVILLFGIGALWAFLHKREKNLLTIFQLGIVAPALITGMLQSQELKYNRNSLEETKLIAEFKESGEKIAISKVKLAGLILSAYADDLQSDDNSDQGENRGNFLHVLWAKLKRGAAARPIDAEPKELMETLKRKTNENLNLKSELKEMQRKIDQYKALAILPSECENEWRNNAGKLADKVEYLEGEVKLSRLELKKCKETLESAQIRIEYFEKIMQSQ